MVASQMVLLVVDVQAGLFAGDRRVYDGDRLVQRINIVIAQARQASVPVVFIQDKDVGPLDSPEWRLHPALQSKSDDLTIHKAYGDSFYHTALQAELAAQHAAADRGWLQDRRLCRRHMSARDQPGLRRNAGGRWAFDIGQPIPDRAAEHRLLQCYPRRAWPRRRLRQW